MVELEETKEELVQPAKMLKHDHFRFLATANPFGFKYFEGVNPSTTTTLDGITSNGHFTSVLWKDNSAVVFPAESF
jgi:hypothetical protein